MQLYACFIQESSTQGVPLAEPIALVKTDKEDEAKEKVREMIGPFPGLTILAMPLEQVGPWLSGAFNALREQAQSEGIAWCTEGETPFA